MTDLFRSIFDAAPTHAASAPGRIEFIGNHTDYNGGLVLGAAIDRTVQVALRLRDDRRLVLASTAGGDTLGIDLDALARQSGEAEWTNYPLGMVHVLRVAGLGIDRGFELLVHSNLPVGAGLSSSAALELATAYALVDAFDGAFDRATLARLARRAENEFVGVPCGILDQGVSAFGLADHLVGIDCRDERFTNVTLPHGIAFWIFNSHQKHALIGSLYAERHRECMEAAALLAPHFPGRTFLADYTPAEIVAHRADLGESRYRRALHVASENGRVARMTEVLAASDLEAAGRLLIESHYSSRDLFENSTPELDFLVERLVGLPSVYGARLTGGGFGGAVMAMTGDGFTTEHADEVADAYATTFGDRPDVLQCHTADGAHVVDLSDVSTSPS